MQTLTNGQEFAVGYVHVTALATPGHTPDSFAFLIAGRYLLTGDALFVSGVGRPDLGGHAREWGVDLYRSLEQLQTLPGDMVILPAHYGHWSEINAGGTVSGILRDLQENNPLLHESVETFLTHVESSANSEASPLRNHRGIQFGPRRRCQCQLPAVFGNWPQPLCSAAEAVSACRNRANLITEAKGAGDVQLPLCKEVGKRREKTAARTKCHSSRQG